MVDYLRAEAVKEAIRFLSSEEKARILTRFFKTGKGEYGEGDIFLGVQVPEVRKVVKEFATLPLEECIKLLQSPEHEFRLCALLIWVHQAKKQKYPKAIFEAFLANSQWVNNWDLVDQAAPAIVGGYLLDKDRAELYRLIASESLWEQRIAIVATLTFIREGESHDTLALSEQLLNHKHDLMHKASGWMLREMGKRNLQPLLAFLDQHGAVMPRTMLRYAIEKLSPEERSYYMQLKNQKSAL